MNVNRFVTCLVIAANLLGVVSEDCDRNQSRTVRRIINEYVLRPLTAEDYTFPADCPLDPTQDKYLWQEQHKQQESSGLWKCLFCGKKFVSEAYLDRHLSLRHETEFLPNASLCLADVCSIVHCDYFLTNDTTSFYGVGKIVQQKQHVCERIMHKCFPPINGAQAHRLYQYTLLHFCTADSGSPIERINRLEEMRADGSIGKVMLDIYVLFMIFLSSLCFFWFRMD